MIGLAWKCLFIDSSFDPEIDVNDKQNEKDTEQTNENGKFFYPI